MTRMVEATRQIGAATLGTLEAHHERLGRMRDTAAAQSAQFEEAERELRSLAEGMLGDRITQGLLLLILFSLVAAVTSRFSLPAPPPGWQSGSGRMGPGGWPRTVYSPLDERTQ